MMHMCSFPMNRSDGSKISLEELLTVVPGGQWTWHVLVFCGIGCAPGGRTMTSFEEEVRSSEDGVVMTWTELNDFARALDQTIDCQIVATALRCPVFAGAGPPGACGQEGFSWVRDGARRI